MALEQGEPGGATFPAWRMQHSILWRIIVIGLALNAATGVAVVGAVGWMLSGS